MIVGVSQFTLCPAQLEQHFLFSLLPSLMDVSDCQQIVVVSGHGSYRGFFCNPELSRRNAALSPARSESCLCLAKSPACRRRLINRCRTPRETTVAASTLTAAARSRSAQSHIFHLFTFFRCLASHLSHHGNVIQEVLLDLWSSHRLIAQPDQSRVEPTERTLNFRK